MRLLHNLKTQFNFRENCTWSRNRSKLKRRLRPSGVCSGQRGMLQPRLRPKGSASVPAPAERSAPSGSVQKGSPTASSGQKGSASAGSRQKGSPTASSGQKRVCSDCFNNAAFLTEHSGDLSCTHCTLYSIVKQTLSPQWFMVECIRFRI